MLATTRERTTSIISGETVRVFVTNDRNQVLLVKERGKRYDEHDEDGNGRDWRKMPGWNLPGGKIEGTVDQMCDGIKEQLRRQGIELLRLGFTSLQKQFPRLEHVVFTAIKEVLEETGLFVVPTHIELWRRYDNEIVWFVQAREVLSGRRGSLDVHIERCAWHPVDQLPRGMYRRARAMVNQAQPRQKGAKA